MEKSKRSKKVHQSNFRMKAKEFIALRKYCEANDLSMAQVIRRLVLELLNNVPQN